MSSSAPTERRWLRLLVKAAAVPIAALLVWGIVKSLEIRPGKSAASPAFKLFPPLEVLGIQKSRSPAVDQRLRTALPQAARTARQAPLSSYPFALRALAAQRGGNPTEAKRLMLRARRLEPRGTAIRTWLMNRHFLDGELTAAVEQAAVIYEIDGTVSPLVSKLLATVAQSPEARATIKRRLGGTPHLLDIVRVSKEAGLHRRHALELLSAAGNSEAQNLAATRAMLLQRYIDEKDFAGAYLAWQSFLPPGIARRGAIYDGNFAGLPGPAPFNWTLTSNEHVSAEIVPSGLTTAAKALSVRRFTNTPAAAASQSLVLNPSTYRLSYVTRAAAGGAAFAWKVVCGSSGSTLWTFPLPASLTQDWTGRSERFEVPATCPFVVLQLGSTSAEVAGEASAMIAEVRVQPVSQQAS